MKLAIVLALLLSGFSFAQAGFDNPVNTTPIPSKQMTTNFTLDRNSVDLCFSQLYKQLAGSNNVKEMSCIVTVSGPQLGKDLLGYISVGKLEASTGWDPNSLTQDNYKGTSETDLQAAQAGFTVASFLVVNLQELKITLRIDSYPFGDEWSNKGRIEQRQIESLHEKFRSKIGTLLKIIYLQKK